MQLSDSARDMAEMMAIILRVGKKAKTFSYREVILNWSVPSVSEKALWMPPFSEFDIFLLIN